MEHILTSEAVTRGHPDKICDQIADAVLDAVLAEEPEARLACETAVWKDGLCIFGELSARQEPDYETIAREVLRKIGYDRPELGFDWETCSVQVHMHTQSPDIARGVRHRAAEDTGAGDQASCLDMPAGRQKISCRCLSRWPTGWRGGWRSWDGTARCHGSGRTARRRSA